MLAPAWSSADIEKFKSCLYPAGTTIIVTPGKLAFEVIEDGHHYSINPESDDVFELLFDTIAALNLTVDQIVHAWFLEHESNGNLNNLDTDLCLGIHAAHACARGVSKLSTPEKVQLDFLTVGGQFVTGVELIYPMASSLIGPAKVIPLEYPNINCRHLDIEFDIANLQPDSYLADVLSCTHLSGVFALRHGFLWEPAVSQVQLIDDQSNKIKNGGSYLIVGGLGGVGLSIAEYLVNNYNAHLTLTSRNGRPQRADEDTEAAKRLALLEKIESLSLIHI